MQRLSVAVVGGGVAGASCAWRLAQSGHTVELFDLGRKLPGGRSSTRRVLGTAGDGMQFDHGAQFLTATNPKTQPLIDELRAAGKLSVWEPRVAEVNSSSGAVALKEGGQLSGGFFGSLSSSPLYVGQPSMDAICAHLTSHSAIKLQLGTRVSGVAFDSGSQQWQLHGHPTAGKPEVALGQFDALVCTDIQCGRTGSPSFVTARGEAAEAALHEFQQAAAAAGLRRTPLFALLLGYDTRAGAGAGAPELPFDAATFSTGSSFAWLANDSSKPGRPIVGLQCWVAVSSEAFGAELLGAKVDSPSLPAQDAAYLAERQGRMMAAARQDLKAAGLELPEPSKVHVHRWGSAFVASPLGVPCISHPDSAFVAAGDFCLGVGIESAMLSGLAAADAVDAAASAKGK